MVSHTVMARLVNLTGKGVGEEFFGMLITWNSAGHHAALVVGPSTPANVMKSVIGTGWVVPAVVTAYDTPAVDHVHYVKRKKRLFIGKRSSMSWSRQQITRVRRKWCTRDRWRFSREGGMLELSGQTLWKIESFFFLSSYWVACFFFPFFFLEYGKGRVGIWRETIGLIRFHVIWRQGM